MTRPTGNGGAVRFVRRKGDLQQQYRLTFWSKSEEKMIETNILAESPQQGTEWWVHHVFADNTIDGITCG